MTGQLIAAASTVLVAIIGVVGLVVRARVRPGKSDVTIPQLWERLDTQSDRIEALEGKLDDVLGSNDTLRTAARILGEGFDALTGFLERTTHEPAFTWQEREAVSRAKEIRADDSIWNTRQHPARIYPS